MPLGVAEPPAAATTAPAAVVVIVVVASAAAARRGPAIVTVVIVADEAAAFVAVPPSIAARVPCHAFLLLGVRVEFQVERDGASGSQVCSAPLQVFLSLLEPAGEVGRIEAVRPRLGENTVAGLLFFADVVLDLLGQEPDLGIA